MRSRVGRMSKQGSPLVYISSIRLSPVFAIAFVNGFPSFLRHLQVTPIIIIIIKDIIVIIVTVITSP